MKFYSYIGNTTAVDELDSFSTYNCLKDEGNTEVFFSATIQDTRLATDLANAAFPIYSNLTPEIRRNFLHKIADNLDANRDALIQMYQKEASLSMTRGNSELDRTIFQLRNYGDALMDKNWNRPIESHPANTSFVINTKLYAIGPVAVFGSSNFPFAYSTAGGDTASALAAGCPVIVKAHPMHAGTSCLVAKCIQEAVASFDLPNGVFSHLLDGGHEVGTELVSNPNIKAVGFTGSIRGGRSLMDTAAKRLSPIPVFAEMGSVNPVFVFQGELERNGEMWVDKFAKSIATDAGQFCTKPGLIFAPNTPEGIEFLNDLEAQLKQADPTCHLHPALFNNFKSQVEESFDWIETRKPFHSQPVLRRVTAQDYLFDYKLQEEHFGPQAIGVIYEDAEQLLKMQQKLEGQLTSTFIATEEELTQHANLLQEVMEKAGRIIFNGVPTGVAVADAMVHGGVYPSSSDSRFTAVGNQAMYRFLRPVAFQTVKR